MTAASVLATYDRMMHHLDNARYVRVDYERGFIIAWFGGHGIHAYARYAAEETMFWNIEGDDDDDNVTFDMIVRNVEEHLTSGEYLDLY